MASGVGSKTIPLLAFDPSMADSRARFAADDTSVARPSVNASRHNSAAACPTFGAVRADSRMSSSKRLRFRR